jgi:uncharacterized protein YecT (DUF1311 family)
MIRLLLVLTLLMPISARAETESERAIEDCIDSQPSIEIARAECLDLGVRNCLDSPDGATTVGMVGCFASAESAWNSVRQSALARLSEAAKASDDYYTEQGDTGFANSLDSLTKAEAAWEAWRDLECISRADDNGNGSMRRIVAASCRLDLMRERVVQHWFR